MLLLSLLERYSEYRFARRLLQEDAHGTPPQVQQDTEDSEQQISSWDEAEGAEKPALTDSERSRLMLVQKLFAKIQSLLFCGVCSCLLSSRQGFIRYRIFLS